MASKKQRRMYERVIEEFGGVMATSRALEVTQASVSAWKSGKAGMSMETAIKVGDLCGCNPFLLSDDLCQAVAVISTLWPEQVFSPEQLKHWAQRNGYRK